MEWSRTRAGAACLLLILCALYPIFTTALTAEEVYQKVKNSVYTVYSVDSHTQIVKARGSAIAGSKTVLITNCHIALIADRLFVKLPNSPNPKPAQLFYKNEQQDLCLLKIPNANFVPVKIRPSSEVHIGEEVYAVGNPEGTEKSLSKGIISNKHKVKGGEWLQTDAAIYFGSSGGGLFDNSGNLIGITTKMGGSFGFAIPTEWIKQALAQAQLHPQQKLKTVVASTSQAHPEATQGLSYLGAYGRDKIKLYRNYEECFLLIPGTDTNGNLTSAILWNPRYNLTLVIFPSTADAKEALSIIYGAMLDKSTKKQTSYQSKSKLYIADQPYLLYGSSIEGKKYPFLITRFSENPRAVFLNSRAFRIIFNDTDPGIGKTTIFYHLNGVAEALSAYNANCF